MTFCWIHLSSNIIINNYNSITVENAQRDYFLAVLSQVLSGSCQKYI